MSGGNGSRSFRSSAPRDAHHPHLRGHQRINRLIIPTRLLKQSPGVFTADGVREALSDRSAPADRPLAAERDLVARGKRLVVAALGQAAASYGDGLKEEQEVLGHVADIVIEVYAVESALARTDKLAAARGAERAGIALDIARVYATDAADRIAHSGKQVVAALAARGAGEPVAGLVREVATRAGVDTIAARRRPIHPPAITSPPKSLQRVCYAIVASSMAMRQLAPNSTRSIHSSMV